MNGKKFLLIFLSLTIIMSSICFAGCDDNEEDWEREENGDTLTEEDKAFWGDIFGVAVPTTEGIPETWAPIGNATPTIDRITPTVGKTTAPVTTAPVTTAPSTTAPITTSSRTQTLYIWWEQNANDLILLQDAWYDFRQLYAGTKYAINIDMFSMPGDANGTAQLEQQVISGTAPDVVRMDHVYITSLGQKGVLLDLQKQFGATDALSDQFITSTWKASSSGDAVYGIPFDANTVIFGAKTTVLEQAEVSIPTTYAQLLTAGEKIQNLYLSENVYTLPCGINSGNWPVFLYLTWLWRLGGDVLNEDMTEAVFNKTETGVQALQMIMQLRDEGLISAYSYEEGGTIMGDYGTWWMNGFMDDMQFTLQPQLKEGVPRYSGLGLYDLAVVSTTGNRQLAYDFVVHFATGKSAVTGRYYVSDYCKNYTLIPSLKAAAQADESGSMSDFWKISVQQLELSKYRPAVSCWAEIESALSSALIAAMSGQKTPQRALDDAAAITNRLLAEG